MKVYRLTVYPGATPVVMTLDNLFAYDAQDDVEALDVGDKLTIEAIEMTQEEIEALQEWDGP